MGSSRNLEPFTGRTGRRLRLATFALLLATAALAAEPGRATPEPWTVNFYLENDLFVNTDNDYTNGLRLSFISPDLDNYLDDPTLPQWVREINRQLAFMHGSLHGVDRNLVLAIGQAIYTPADPVPAGLIVDDRPYAGWLYGMVGYQTKKRDRLDSLELHLGVVGPASQAEAAQDLIHGLRHIEKFNGWHNQLDNEPGLIALYEHKDRLFRHRLRDGFGGDLIAHGGIALGNVASYLNLGGTLRLGHNVPDDFGSSPIRPGGDNSAPGSSARRYLNSDHAWGGHLFASVDGRLVGRDIFLDGNTFEESHHVHKERFTGDLSVGAVFHFQRYRVVFSRVFTAQEFEEQRRSHSFGSLMLSYFL